MNKPVSAALALAAIVCCCGGLQGAPVTFNKEIAPLLFKHCAVCHRPGEVAPFSLLTFADAAKRAAQIEDVVVRGAMPPWKPLGARDVFTNERRLTSDEIALVRQWVADGSMEGRAADLPPTPEFPSGWRLGKPDLVLTVPEPIAVAADARDTYMNVILPLKVPFGMYLKATEFRPGNPRVVHHAILMIDTSGKARERDKAAGGKGFVAIVPPGVYLPGALGIWAAGRNPMPLPAGLAMPWPNDATLILNMHLQNTGKPETDQSSVGFYFTAEPPERPLADMTLTDMEINIPAGEKAYRTHDRKAVPFDAEVLTIFPHMHMLGRAMKVTAYLPDGTMQTLLEIDDWDYNWQDIYQYAAPIRVPLGTVLALDAIHDNSADNPQNPRHPPGRVRWGENADDEMSMAFISLAPVMTSAAGRKGPVPAPGADDATLRAVATMRQADTNNDQRLSENEIFLAYGKTRGRQEIKQMIARFDRDGDRHLNLEESLNALKASGP